MAKAREAVEEGSGNGKAGELGTGIDESDSGSRSRPHSEENRRADEELNRFGELLKGTRDVFRNLLTHLGILHMPAKVDPDQFGWTAAESIPDFNRELARYAKKISEFRKTPEQVYREIGGDQFEVLQQMGVDPFGLIEPLREIETRSGLPLLPENPDHLDRRAKSVAIKDALKDAMERFALGKGITAADLPEAFRPWFENRRQIADLAIDGFDGGLDLHRLDDRYLRPAEIASKPIDPKNKQALEYSDGIVNAVLQRGAEGNPDKLVDADQVAPGEVYQLTEYMLQMSKSEFEIVVIYGKDDVLKDTRRGEGHKIEVRDSDVEEGNRMFHNHPTPGMPPSSKDFSTFLLNWKTEQGVIVNEEDGSITMYAVKAHPEKKFPDLAPKEREARWVEFVDKLVREHRKICDSAGESLNARREAARKALALLKEAAGDSVTINHETVWRKKE